MNEMIDDYEFVRPFSLLKENRKSSWVVFGLDSRFDGR